MSSDLMGFETEAKSGAFVQECALLSIFWKGFNPAELRTDIHSSFVAAPSLVAGQNVPKLFGVLVDVYKTDMADEEGRGVAGELRVVSSRSFFGGGSEVWYSEALDS